MTPPSIYHNLNYPLRLLADPSIISPFTFVFTYHACGCKYPINLLIPPMMKAMMSSLGSNILLGGDGSFTLDFPKITDLNLLNLLPWGGLVKKSPNILSEGKLSLTTYPVFTLSFIKKYQMLVILVLFLLNAFPFLFNNMALVLSWYILDNPTRYPWASKNYFVQNSCIITSFVATSSVSVDILVLSFCLWGV